ncbi:immunity protein PncM [Streptococcus pyogenes]|nr:immunity protein PncM [Streptococcus pyogenes]
MDKKKIISTIISAGFLIVSVSNFFRELSPILFLLNIIGFSCFLLLFSASMKKIVLKK